VRRQELEHYARQIVRVIRGKGGGDLPRDAGGWGRLCRRFGIDCIPLAMSAPGFTARLICLSGDGYQLFYNRDGTDEQRARWLCHEVSEYIALADFPGLLDPPDHARYQWDYDGGDDPADSRHRIARRVEELCFRG